MYQQTTIVGRATKDPVIRYTASGAAVCNFDVAVNKTWKTQDGEKRESVKYFRVAAWRGLGETCSEYVRKGMLILVTGEIDVNAYAGNDGQPRASLELTARDVKFLPSGRDQQDQRQENADERSQQVDDSDIPF